MDYKAAALESLDRLKGLTMAGTAERRQLEGLENVLKKETDPATVWRMYQHLREAIAEEEPQEVDTSFKVKGKDGKVKVYKNLAELDASIPPKKNRRRRRDNTKSSLRPEQGSRQSQV